MGSEQESDQESDQNSEQESEQESEQDSLAVLTFRDALGLAMELADEYAFVNAAALIGRNGQLEDLIIAEGIGRTIEPVVGWLATTAERRLPSWRCGTTDVVLITVRPFDVEVIREDDLWAYRRAGWAIAAAGANLIDWIETDGDLFRSYAYVTCPERAWSGDPPADRLSDGRQT